MNTSADVELGRRTISRRWWKHHGRQQPTFGLGQDRFLKACAGENSNIEPATSRARLDHFQYIVRESWLSEFDQLFPATLAKDGPCYLAMIACTEVIMGLRTRGCTSITGIIQRLQEKKVLRDDGALPADAVAQQMIFRAIGWITLLYFPDHGSSEDSFGVLIQGTKSEVRPSVSMDKASRPLDELLRSFGNLIPKRLIIIENQETKNTAAKLLVSYLNVATLKAVGNLEIIWVDSISAHLEFDPTIPSLSIFRCPSFCRTQRALGSTLEIILEGYYEEDELPSKNFSVSNLMDEIIMSYALLFKCDRRSRKVYQNQERDKAAIPYSALIDPGLDELCSTDAKKSGNARTAPVRDSFDSEADFPILKQRLLRVQHYMEGIQPNRFMSLWRDRRDLKLWYTIWVVIILQTIGLMIGAVSMFLSSAQVNYAEKAYNLQVQQGRQQELQGSQQLG